MTRYIGQTIDVLLNRVRQSGGIAIDPDLATRIYSYCEQVINTYTRRVTATTTLTTGAEKLVYNYRREITDAIDIVSVRDSGRRVERQQWLGALAAYDQTWFRNITGTRYELWAQVGRDILVLYPAKASASSVTVQYTKLLTYHDDFSASYNTASELPDEDVESALSLAEVVLLTRNRQLAEVKLRLADFAETVRLRGRNDA